MKRTEPIVGPLSSIPQTLRTSLRYLALGGRANFSDMCYLPGPWGYRSHLLLQHWDRIGTHQHSYAQFGFSYGPNNL